MKKSFFFLTIVATLVLAFAQDYNVFAKPVTPRGLSYCVLGDKVVVACAWSYSACGSERACE